jgi:hypothetical protein
MRTLTIIGIIVLALGIAAFVVPLPKSEHHGVKIGDSQVGITTRHSEKIPPVAAGLICVVGAVLLVAATRK